MVINVRVRVYDRMNVSVRANDYAVIFSLLSNSYQLVHAFWKYLYSSLYALRVIVSSTINSDEYHMK